MGFESFGVGLEGGAAKLQEATDVIMALEHVMHDDDSAFVSGSNYFLVRDDGRHAIEVELMGPPVVISCRFTLCHPPSIDAAFLDLVRNLMQKLDLRVRIRDDVTPEHSRLFSIEQFDPFAEACVYYIARRRREWKQMFGNRQLAATTAEAHHHIILPQCVPLVNQPG